MRVLVNAFSARRGGILTYTSNVLRALKGRGIDVIAAVSPEFELPENVEAIRAPVANYHPVRRFLWEQTAWLSIVRRVKPDVLFSSANFALLRSPVPQLLLMREGGLFDPFYLNHVSPNQGVLLAVWRALRRFLMLASVRRAEMVMTPSQAMKDLLIEWQPDSAGKIQVNRYGVPDNLFAPSLERRAWRADGVLRVLFVSVYYPHKSPGDVCRLVERLGESGISAHATITMTLDEVSSALDLRAMRRLQDKGLLTLGRRPYRELPQLYASHDVFVFPAVSETFGHPMAEAMSSGIPVVAVDTPTAREVCGDCALYAKPFRPADLFRRVMELDADPALRKRLAAGGRTRVLSDLKWANHIDRLIDLFERMKR